MAQADLFWRQLGMHPTGQVPPPAGGGAAARAQPGLSAPPGAPAQPAAAFQSAAVAQPPPAVADDETPWIVQLRKLAELHDQGVLSDAAYEAAKRRVISQE